MQGRNSSNENESKLRMGISIEATLHNQTALRTFFFIRPINVIMMIHSLLLWTFQMSNIVFNYTTVQIKLMSSPVSTRPPSKENRIDAKSSILFWINISYFHKICNKSEMVGQILFFIKRQKNLKKDFRFFDLSSKIEKIFSYK